MDHPETSGPAPHAMVALVDEEIDKKEQPIPAPAPPEAAAAPVPEETQAMRPSEKPVTLQQTRQLGQPLGEGRLSSGSKVDDM